MTVAIQAFEANQEADFADRIPIDAEHTLDQLLSRFSQVKDGLPELVKNSKDQYARLKVLDRADRQILVFINTTSRAIGVVDFAGASRQDFEFWKTWSGHHGARKGLAEDIEAGHGNGGKAFMVRGASKTGYMESYSAGRFTRMGYRNDNEAVRYRPATFKENGNVLFDYPESNHENRFQNFLKLFNSDLASIPDAARKAFLKRKAYTGIYLIQIAEWVGARSNGIRTRVSELSEMLASHGQAAMTLDTCDVCILVDGAIQGDGPLQTSQLEPHAGFLEAREWSIPDTLVDPRRGDKVDTVAGFTGQRYLRLHTSRKNLQLREELKPRNVIRIWNDRNNVASWPLPSLVAMPSVYFIYGEMRCPALQAPHLAGADRIHLDDTPLARALQAWTAEKVEELAKDIQKAQIAETPVKDQTKAKEALRNFRDLMRDFLDQHDTHADRGAGSQGGAKGNNQSGDRNPHPRTEYGTRIDRIILEQGRSAISLAAGTSVPLIYSCIEDQADGTSKPVKDPGLEASFADSGVAAFGPKTLHGIAAGRTSLTLSTSDGAASSNELVIEVLNSTDVDLVVPSVPLKQGERSEILFSFKTPEGSRDDLLIEASVDEPGMGAIGRGGRFTAGGREGTATVRVKFGPLSSDQVSAVIEVGNERMPPRGNGGEDGSDIPDILLCGEDAPGTEDLPADRRTHQGGEEHPTIIEEPQFPNVVWVNPHSAESRRVRKSMGTPKGLGGIGNKTFAQFMAMKCFEILKRLWVRQQIHDQLITETEFLAHSALAEVECASFIDAAWDMSEGLYKKAEAE